MFTSIKISDPNYKFLDSEGTERKGIESLRKINIFVGQNNSGKSRMMRTLLSKKPQARFDNQFDLNTWNQYISELSELLQKSKQHSDSSFSQIESLINDGRNIEFLDQDFDAHIGKLKSIYQNTNSIIDGFVSPGIQQQHRVNFHNGYTPIRNLIEEDFFEVQIGEVKRVYIPLLRGLKNPGGTPDCYGDRAKKDYFTENLEYGFEIFTGLSLFNDIRSMLLGKYEQRENIRKFEKFLSQNFFNNQQITITPFEQPDVLHIKIGQNDDYPIYDVGDGIQSIIILTFPFFKYANEKLLIGIDEPEFGLHPGMQRVLLDTISKGIERQDGESQIFITTHSNHLLDIAMDEGLVQNTSIYQFLDKGPKEKIITNISQNNEVLKLLGVRNSSVFLSNCIIWVEGVSDRIYIKRWIELFNESMKRGNAEFTVFQEDKHYSIVEYGGGNIKHFNFGDPDNTEAINIDAISKNNFVIADNDGNIDFATKPKEGLNAKELRLRELKDLLTDNFCADFPEIENLITYEEFNAFFDRYAHSNNNWTKRSPIGSKDKFDTKVMITDIGSLLKDVFIELKEGKESENFDKGTDIAIIGNKQIIAERMLPIFTDFSDLSEGAKSLTKKLYEFIQANNT